jgi:hypothetical protein
METTTISQIEETINTGLLTLADWVAIAVAAGNKPLWGWNKWVEYGSNIEAAKGWDLNQWGAVANLLGVRMGWAVNRRDELLADGGESEHVS